MKAGHDRAGFCLARDLDGLARQDIELHIARNEVRQDLRILAASATLAQAHERLRNGTSPVGHN